ncbi:MAG: hypothetical protein RLZZ532_3705 [Cyanobacteriota bacterium]|jgi:hypothetical protein
MRRHAILMILVIIYNGMVAKILKLRPSHYIKSMFPQIRGRVKGESGFFFSIFGKFL